MDHLFLLQFACFLFMLFNAFTLAVTRLQAREACTPTVWRERYLAKKHDSDASLS